MSPVDRGLGAAGGEPLGDGGEAVALLDAQLGEAAHHRAARGEGRRDREDRIFVDHAGRALGRHLDASEAARADHEVGDRLAALDALVGEGDVGAHLGERVVEARPQRI